MKNCHEDISHEYYRNYSYFAYVGGMIIQVESTVYNPKLLRISNGRQYVEDMDGIVHVNPDMGVFGCEITISGNYEGKTIGICDEKNTACR
jgi:hypothetical protein